MDRAWMYDLARIDPMYLENVRQFVEGAKRGMQIGKTKMIYFILVLTVKTKLRGRILK
jgi:spore maturation protein SpmB